MKNLPAIVSLLCFFAFAICAGTSHRRAASVSLVAGFFSGLCACGSPTKEERATVRQSNK
jgi:hypothetical protein